MSHAAVGSKLSQMFAGPAEYTGFWLCDPQEKRIGTVEKIFANWSGEPEYIRVSVGFFGFKSVLLPVQDVAVDEQEVSMALEIRRSTNVPSTGGSKKPTPSPAA